MNKNLKLASFAFGTLALFAMASCSSEEGYLNDVQNPEQNKPTTETTQIGLFMEPDFIVYSGSNFFTGNSRAIVLNPEQTLGDDDVFVDAKKLDNVEVNLSIEEHNLPTASQPGNEPYLSTHLSIHVRSVTDVEVFLNLKDIYYCQVDDFAILAKHNSEDEIFYPSEQGRVLTIGNSNVSVNVTYGENGITVKTAGIDEDVINYCQENYGDGITFEIWNYMNLKAAQWGDLDKNDVFIFGQQEKIEKDELKESLDESTISFLGAAPTVYVNAFYYAWDASKEEFSTEISTVDCKVAPSSPSPFNDPVETVFFNGSPYNQVYLNSSYTPPTPEPEAKPEPKPEPK